MMKEYTTPFCEWVKAGHQKLHTTTVLPIGESSVKIEWEWFRANHPHLTSQEKEYSFSHVDDSFTTVISWVYIYICIYTFIIHLFLTRLLQMMCPRVGTTMPLTLLWDCTMPAWLFQVLWPWICLAMRWQRNTHRLLSIASNPVAIFDRGQPAPRKGPQMIG